jgi:hypothetical protein
MESVIDNMLENIFGGVNLQINVIAGAALIIIGIIVIVLSRKKSTKGKITAGWVCIGIGCLSVLSGVILFLFR